jgi:hypothetical protein
MPSTLLFTFNLLRISRFLWRSNVVSPNSGLKNLICAASSFWASLLFMIQFSLPWSRSSSVSIVSDYWLDDRAIGIRSPVGEKDFSCSLCVQTSSEANPASCTMATGGPSPGAKRCRFVKLTTHPHLVPRSRMSRSYASSPPKRHHGV